MSEIPNRQYEAKGKEWTPEALVIAALLRRLGADHIVFTKDEMKKPKGLLIQEWPSKQVEVVIREFDDGTQEANLDS